MSSVVNSKTGKGFTLLEALVALLVVSVGILAIVAMQVKAMQGAHVSYQRSVATLAAQDMVERLWIELGRTASSTKVCPDSSKTMADGSQVLDDWHDTWSLLIPTLIKDSGNTVTRVSGDECQLKIVVEWVDERFAGDNFETEDVSELVYMAKFIGDEP